MVTAEDLGKVRDDVLPKSECQWSAMSTPGYLHGPVDTYSLANFSCSSTEAKSKKPQRLEGFSTSVPQNTLYGPVGWLVTRFHIDSRIWPSGLLSSMTSIPGLTMLHPASVTTILNCGGELRRLGKSEVVNGRQ